MTIYDYFSSIERGLTGNVNIGFVEEPITCLVSDDHNGLLKCRVRFWDDSYLDIYEVINTERGYPQRVHYAYTYVREGQQVFRYDNAPHHPSVETHPHHKHIGPTDEVTSSEQPTLSEVLTEVEGHLG